LKTYKKTEWMLYEYYKKKKRIVKLKNKLARIESRIEKLKKDIKECNVELYDTMKAIDYSREAVQCSSVTSNIENELMKAIDRLLYELNYSVKEKRKTREKIRYIEKKIDDIDVILEQLTDEELQIIELKYGEEMNYRKMENIMHMGRSTIQRKKDRVVYFIMNEQ
jgi:DNA-directed RNA polymerase specialized sigma24 family protein